MNLIEYLVRYDILNTMNTHNKFDRPLWIEISKSNLFHNLDKIRTIAGDKKMICMVKGNAYGHGAIEIAKLLEEYKVSYLAVVCIAEARELRVAGINTPILLVNEIGSSNIDIALDLNTTITVMDITTLRLVQKIAKRKHKIAKIHVHIDTGMHREGAWPVQLGLEIVLEASKLSNILLEGIFTHFATADELGDEFVLTQLKIFDDILVNIQKHGIILPEFIHSANSGAIINVGSSYSDKFTAIRPGIAMYGLYEGQSEYYFKPVLSLKGRISQIKVISKDHTVGYSRTWKALGSTKLGLITVGYADGLRRELSNSGSMLVHGQKVPIVGRISMDQTIVNLLNTEKYFIGDEVVIIGTQNHKTISVEEIAKLANTITNDIVAGLNAKRIQRFVVD